MADKLTKSQKKALDLLVAGKNCFISGDAGTGKTYLINYFLGEYCQKKEVLRCAYTAMAADHMIGGKTLHSAFRISDYPTVKDRSWSSISDIATYDIVIIDEISMVRIDYFDGFLKTIKRASDKRQLFGRKPIQIILCGDFFQLKPIATDPEIKVLGEIYGADDDGEPKIYAFESDYWTKAGIININLDEVVRQSDKKFVDLLNKIKYCQEPRETIKLISQLTSKKSYPDEKAISLFASNKKVNACNKQHLDALKTKEYKFTALMNEKMIKLVESKRIKEKDLPVEKEIILKEGSRVMFTKNDQYKKGKHSTRQFQNGTLGTFLGADSESFKVRIDETDEIVTVPLEQGLPLEERKYSWSLYDDPICRDKVHVIQNPNPAMMWQIPLKLAYAITIHKSQGQTYDYVNFDPQEDDILLQEGQLYVLLSRLTNIGGLYLINPIQPEQVRTSTKVINFSMKKGAK